MGSKKKDQIAFPKKPKRKTRSKSEVDEERRLEGLLEEIRRGPCTSCFKAGRCDPDHISTVGSGGETSVQNLWPLCRACHVKKGQEGLTTFVARRPHLRIVLICKSWQYDDFLKRWVRPKGE